MSFESYRRKNAGYQGGFYTYEDYLEDKGYDEQQKKTTPSHIKHFGLEVVDMGKISINIVPADCKGEGYMVFNGQVIIEDKLKELLANPKTIHVFGKTFYIKDEIKKADYVAAPGCNATATILALYPLYKNNRFHFNIMLKKNLKRNCIM